MNALRSWPLPVNDYQSLSVRGAGRLTGRLVESQGTPLRINYYYLLGTYYQSISIRLPVTTSQALPPRLTGRRRCEVSDCRTGGGGERPREGKRRMS